MENKDLLTDNQNELPHFGTGAAETTWDLLLALPPGNQRTHLQAKLLGSMFLQDALAQSLWESASISQRREWFAAGFSPNMNANDFEGLEEMSRVHAEATGNQADAKAFLERHGKAWAQRDLAAALDWTQDHLKGRNRVNCREELFRAGTSHDFDATVRIWQRLPEGYQKKHLAEAILRVVPEVRKTEAEALLKSAPD